MDMPIRSGRWGRLLAVAAILSIGTAPAPRRAEADEKAAAPAALTDDSLRKMLTDMGFEFTDNKSAGGTPFFQLTITRNDWSLSPYVNLSPDKSALWIYVFLQKIPAENKNLSAHLRALLEANSSAQVFFNVYKDSGFIGLNRSVPNRGITPVVFRKTIDQFDEYARQTVDLWATGRWSDKPADPPASSKELLPRHDAIRPASPPPKKP